MYYKFSWRRGWFWKSKMVIGHSVIQKFVRNVNGEKIFIGKNSRNEPVFEMEYDKDQDKMILYFKDGELQEIKEWSKCECRLYSDWFIETKKEMENKIGQPIATGIITK